MILLVTPSARGKECGEALQAAIGQPTHVAATLRDGVTHLREQEYTAVVIDQSLLETEPDEGEQMLQHLDDAFPIYVNGAIAGIERVVREVQSALRRWQRELQIARESATHAVWNELKENVTAMLLSCDLALSAPELSAPAAQRIRAIHDLAGQMRARLESAS
jgi:hypothetical protein